MDLQAIIDLLGQAVVVTILANGLAIVLAAVLMVVLLVFAYRIGRHDERMKMAKLYEQLLFDESWEL